MVWNTNCSYPTAGTAIVGGLPLRSMADVAWPCLATIIACTYSVLHLNVIADNSVTKRNARFWRDLKRKARSLLVELSITLLALLAPEWTCGMALIDRMEASRLKMRLNHEQLSKRCKEAPVRAMLKWSTAHAHFIVMGGMRLCCNAADSDILDRTELMLDGRSYLALVREELISCHPPISEAEIGDHSRIGFFTKLVAMWQVIWFATTFIIRLARHLPVSQLEVGVVGYVLTALVIYVLSWDKPKSVDCGTRVYPLRQQNSGDRRERTGSPKAQEYSKHLPAEIASAYGARDCYDHQMERIRSVGKEIAAQVIGPRVTSDRTDRAGAIFMAFLFVLLGSVHVGAWNTAFPTIVDKWLWRTASLTSMGVPVVLLFYLVIARVLDWSGVDIPTAARLGISVYTAARGILMIEMVRCLFYLPPGAFVSTWTNNLPYFG